MIDRSRGTIEKTIAYFGITFALSASFYYAVISLVIAFVFWKKRSELP